MRTLGGVAYAYMFPITTQTLLHRLLRNKELCLSMFRGVSLKSGLRIEKVMSPGVVVIDGLYKRTPGGGGVILRVVTFDARGKCHDVMYSICSSESRWAIQMTLAALVYAVRRQITWLYTPRINRVIGGVVFDNALGVIGSLKSLSIAGKGIGDILAGNVPFCSTADTTMDMTNATRTCPASDREQIESSSEESNDDSVDETAPDDNDPTWRSRSTLSSDSDQPDSPVLLGVVDQIRIQYGRDPMRDIILSRINIYTQEPRGTY